MEVLIVLTKETFNKIPLEIRNEFKHIEFKEENEYEAHKEDPVYIQLYNASKKASKDKRKYLFEKRNN